MAEKQWGHEEKAMDVGLPTKDQTIFMASP
jgi:hypothetical protein